MFGAPATLSGFSATSAHSSQSANRASVSRGRHRSTGYSGRNRKKRRRSSQKLWASGRELGSLVRALGFECLEQRVLLAADFGDAPLSYPTHLSDNGAQHQAIGPTLGSLRDTEGNGVPSFLSDGDGADEDGVTFGAIRVGQLGATVTVNVQNAPTGAKLDAWIDFDGDGNWGGPAEHVADSVSIVNGNNVLTFDVPSGAADGVTFARFRLSTAGNLGVGGAAADGEVEDHAVTIAPPTAAAGIFSPQKTIATDADGATRVFAADVDGDGDMDVLSASPNDNTIAWYENIGAQTFTTHTISATDNQVRSVYGADMDGDGDMDVVSAGGSVTWYENNGAQGFTSHVIDPAVGAFTVYAADVDGDGDLDVLSARYIGAVLWFENDGTQNFTTRLISGDLDQPTSVYAVDVDGDGDLDVLSATISSGAYSFNRIAWFENDGTPANGIWATHTISTSFTGAYSVYGADLDDDGDIDVLSDVYNPPLGGNHKIAWYENDGTPAIGTWGFRTVITNSIADVAKSVYAADVDGDSDLDIFSASQDDDTIAWYDNDGAHGQRHLDDPHDQYARRWRRKCLCRRHGRRR